MSLSFECNMTPSAYCCCENFHLVSKMNADADQIHHLLSIITCRDITYQQWKKEEGGLWKFQKCALCNGDFLMYTLLFFSPTLAIFRVSGHIKGSCHMITYTWFPCLNLFSQWRSKEQQSRNVYVFRFFLLLN